MSVYLRCADIRMTKHFLHRTNVCATHQKVRGKRVTQRVWAHFLSTPAFVEYCFKSTHTIFLEFAFPLMLKNISLPVPSFARNGRPPQR